MEFNIEDFTGKLEQDDNSTTLTYPGNITPVKIDDEVTHEVFFGENIRRVINTLKT